MAQGAANIVVPFFGGIPVTGAIARTMTNINNGGRTAVAGMIHAVVLLLMLLFLGGLTKHIPMACLAGVLIMVSYNMSGWRTVRSLLKGPKSDVMVMAVTFFLTVVFNLTIAIEIGMLMAVFLFVKRVSETTSVSVLRGQLDTRHHSDVLANKGDKAILAKGVEVYEIDGPFFFGVANKFDDVMRRMGDKPLVRIVRMRSVPFIDSTGVYNLETFVRSSQKEHIHIILSGVTPGVHLTLEKMGIEAMVGADNIFSHIDNAVAHANKLAPMLAQKRAERHSRGKAPEE